MDQTVEDLLAANIQEVRASLLSFQNETRENFRRNDEQFTQMQQEMRDGFAAARADTLRVEQNMYSLFASLFAKLGIDTAPDMLT